MPAHPLIKNLLAEKIRANLGTLAKWYTDQTAAAPVPFYSSVDMRDAGFKIAPVDHNLYPAGFNNICHQDRAAAPTIAAAHLKRIAGRMGREPFRRILVLPEAHTKNRFYAENIKYLAEIFDNAGVETRVGWIAGDEPVELETATGDTIRACPVALSRGRLVSDGFDPDLILLNNDFSGGYPDILDQVEQPILPSHELGWHSRRKSEHFRHYNRLAGEFARLIDIDPWLIQVDTVEVAGVNFNRNEGIDRVREAAGQVLERTRESYETHGIAGEPFVFIKNNAGTYGMGIMTARSVDDLAELNRRARNKMSVGKGRTDISSLIVQEGIPTAIRYEGHPAEPVIYLFGSELVGGFLRTHTKRGTEENLNAPGMVFEKLCMSDLQRMIEDSVYGSQSGGEVDPDERLLELVYGSIARLAALATGRELKVQKDSPTPM